MQERSVSVRELRNHTAEVMRRVVAGEALSLTVNRRPVADIVPHDPGTRWTSAAVVRSIAVDTPADRGLLADLSEDLEQRVDEL